MEASNGLQRVRVCGLFGVRFLFFGQKKELLLWYSFFDFYVRRRDYTACKGFTENTYTDHT